MAAPLDSQAVRWATISKLEEADLMLARLPELPLGPDDVYTMDKVTPSWLTKVLGYSVPGAEVLATTIVGGHEGMTSRHKWRLVWNKAGQTAELPTAIFFKATPENAHLREMLSLLHMAERECHVYNEIQDELKDLIPKAYYARSYAGGRHIIILEDIEERGITPHWMGDTCSIPFARAVAVAMAKIHSRFWNSPRFESDMVWVRPHCRRYGERWQQKFFNDNRKKFLEMDVGKNCDEDIRNLIKAWDEGCVKAWAYFDRKPPTILHGDSHLGNVLEYADGTAGMYDWQCLFRGYGYRDLSYFLMSALTAEDCEEHEREIFDLYTDTLAESGIEVDRAEAWLDYCLLALDRLDSTMTSLSNGGYGHAPHALLRQVRTISAAAKKHDVATLLDRVVQTGSIWDR